MKNILVVDDEKALCDLYKAELQDSGYTVLVANSGTEALSIAAEQPVDLVILDIKMPGMDGIETLQKLVGNDHGVPVILNTAYGHFKEDFKTWNADAYVMKSSDISELLRTVDSFLKS
jgi:DNA-binding response OmpR family regulator